MCNGHFLKTDIAFDTHAQSAALRMNVCYERTAFCGIEVHQICSVSLCFLLVLQSVGGQRTARASDF